MLIYLSARTDTAKCSGGYVIQSQSAEVSAALPCREVSTRQLRSCAEAREPEMRRRVRWQAAVLMCCEL